MNRAGPTEVAVCGVRAADPVTAAGGRALIPPLPGAFGGRHPCDTRIEAECEDGPCAALAEGGNGPCSVHAASLFDAGVVARKWLLVPPSASCLAIATIARSNASSFHKLGVLFIAALLSDDAARFACGVRAAAGLGS